MARWRWRRRAGLRRCSLGWAKRRSGAGTSAPSMLQASVVAETSRRQSDEGPIRSRGVDAPLSRPAAPLGPADEPRGGARVRRALGQLWHDTRPELGARRQHRKDFTKPPPGTQDLTSLAASLFSAGKFSAAVFDGRYLTFIPGTNASMVRARGGRGRGESHAHEHRHERVARLSDGSIEHSVQWNPAEPSSVPTRCVPAQLARRSGKAGDRAVLRARRQVPARGAPAPQAVSFA